MFRLLFIYTTGLLLLLAATNVAGVPISSTVVKASQFSAGADTPDIPSVLQPRVYHSQLSELNKQAKEAFKRAAALQRDAKEGTHDETLKKEHDNMAALLDNEAKHHQGMVEKHNNMHRDRDGHPGDTSKNPRWPSVSAVTTAHLRAVAIQENTIATMKSRTASGVCLKNNYCGSAEYLNHEALRFHTTAKSLTPNYPTINHIPVKGIKGASNDGRGGVDSAEGSRKHVESHVGPAAVLHL